MEMPRTGVSQRLPPAAAAHLGLSGCRALPIFTLPPPISMTTTSCIASLSVEPCRITPAAMALLMQQYKSPAVSIGCRKIMQMCTLSVGCCLRDVRRQPGNRSATEGFFQAFE